MKFHDFSPFYRSSEGIKPKVSGDRLLDNPLVADAQSGASFKFDVQDRVTLPSATLDQQTNGAISAWFKYDSFRTDTNTHQNGAILSKGNVYFSLTNNSDKKLVAYYYDGSQNITNIGTTILEVGQWYHAVYAWTPTTAKLYLNGVQEFSGTNTGIGYNLHAGHVGGVCYIGDTDAATGGHGDFDGEIRQVRIHNRALSADEVRAAYSGQAVSFEYTGASQDNLITGSSIWADGGGGNIGTVTTNSDNDVTWDQTGAGDTGTNLVVAYHTNWVLTNGTAYRVSFKAKVSSGTATLKHRPWGDDVKEWNLTTSFQEFSFEEVLTAGENNAYFYSTSSSSLTYTVEDYKITQIGCVAEYLPTGISATKWVDTSGNGLHGSTSTATAVNHEVGTLTTVGDIRIGSGSGISFSPYDETVTGPPGSDSNTLDDYEEGTWTPVYDSNSNSSGTWSTATGEYTRVGNMVTLTAKFSGTSQGFSTTGGWRKYTGVPFNPSLSSGGTWISGSLGDTVGGLVACFTGSTFWLYAPQSTNTANDFYATVTYLV